VVIPARDEEHRVQLVVAALKAGVGAADWEWARDVRCIVVDDTEAASPPLYHDGGTDAALTVITRPAPIAPPYDQETPAKSAAGGRTVGARRASTDAVLFLDAHVVPSNECWRAIRAHVDALPGGVLRHALVHFPLQFWNQRSDLRYTHYQLDLEWNFWGTNAPATSVADPGYPHEPVAIPSSAASAVLVRRALYLSLLAPPSALEGYLAGADETGVDLRAWMHGVPVLLEPRGHVVIHEPRHEYPDGFTIWNRNALATAHRLGGAPWLDAVARALERQPRGACVDRAAILRTIEAVEREDAARPRPNRSLDDVLIDKPWERWNAERGLGAFNSRFEYFFLDPQLAQRFDGRLRPS
jgi:hypothetical protein